MTTTQHQAAATLRAADPSRFWKLSQDLILQPGKEPVLICCAWSPGCFTVQAPTWEEVIEQLTSKT